MSLYDISKRDVAEDVFRLNGVEFVVSSDEQLAKARVNYPNIKGSIQLKVSWTPMTYRKFIGDEQVTEETDYIRMNKSSAIDDSALPLLREAGMNAVAASMLISLPKNPMKADLDKQEQEYQRFMVGAAKAGITFNKTDDGKLVTPQAGQLFRCRSGFEEYPTPGEDAKGNFKWDWDNTRSTFMRIPVALVTDFVEPADDEKREFRYERQSSGESATTTTSGQGAGFDAGDIVSALAQLGINGKPASMIDANALQLVTARLAELPALGTLVAAATSGTLVEKLRESGYVTVVDGNLVLAA